MQGAILIQIVAYHGHQGALWTVDVDPTTTLLASGGADNTIRLWEVKTGKLLKTWDFLTAIKRVEFSPDGRQLLGVTEKRSGQLSTIVVYEINPDPEGEQTNEQTLRIVCDESKATVAGFSYLAQYIISGHEDGTVSQFDAKSGELLYSTQVHEPDLPSRRILVRYTGYFTDMLQSRICNGLQIGPTLSPLRRTRLLR